MARALDREFVRVSLGGVRDEAEIRGHRRTYIGSMPGRIIQGLKKAGTKNPVFLLDEVDKMSSDFRGDPASALLEVLDPEQNCAFNDHYLDVDFDLSEVMFITTANVLHTIPPALEDRMEVIRLPGYLRHEKIQIAKKFLVPKQLEANGLVDLGVTFSQSALVRIIEDYTREAGVRNLEREIANICRKIAPRARGGQGLTTKVTPAAVKRFLGMARFLSQEVETESRVGVATGLAWTSVGGEILTVEVLTMKGDGTPDPDRQARRGHAGVREGGALLREGARGRTRDRRGAPGEHRHPYPRSGGRDSEGRSVGRCRHGDGARLCPDRQGDEMPTSR